MKKLLFLLVILGTAFMYSCGTDDPKKDEDIPDDPLTPEANKELLQDIAVEFVQEMSLMEATETSQTLISFGLLVDESGPEAGRVAGKVNRLNKPILAFIHQRITSIQLAKSASRVSEDEPGSLQELFDEYKGVFAWNSATTEWEYTEGGDVIAFEFPSVEDGTTNNAVLTLRNYEGTIISNPIEDEYEGDLPVSLELDLFVDEVKEMAYSFDIDYSSEGEPEHVETSLFVNPFELSVTLTNTESKVGTGVLFTNDTKVLIDIDTEINGNFDAEVIESVEDDDDITNVIFDGSVSVTLLDFNMSASINFDDFYNEVKDLDTYHYYGEGDPTEDFEANAETLESALNEHLILTTKYVSTDRIAAEAEWYAIVEEDEYEISIELGARMVFEDESKVDIEDYFAAGFGELESEINNLIEQIGEDVGEDLEPVEFD